MNSTCKPLESSSLSDPEPWCFSTVGEIKRGRICKVTHANQYTSSKIRLSLIPKVPPDLQECSQTCCQTRFPLKINSLLFCFVFFKFQSIFNSHDLCWTQKFPFDLSYSCFWYVIFFRCTKIFEKCHIVLLFQWADHVYLLYFHVKMSWSDLTWRLYFQHLFTALPAPTKSCLHSCDFCLHVFNVRFTGH